MGKPLSGALNIDLEAIQSALREVVNSDSDLPSPSPIRDHVLKLLDAGGKRLRPILVIVGSRFGQPVGKPIVMRTAVMLEYLHTASLIHDDVIDRSELRRGVPTLHSVTDVHTAVHVANYMMARAIEWTAGIGDGKPPDEGGDSEFDETVQHSMELASIVPELCLGEYVQLRDRFNFDRSMDEYLSKTRSKTALLMAHCLRAGARAAGAEDEVCRLLFDYGEAIGMAFQIRDDVLDYTQPESAIGKPAGSDLRNGALTLPVLYALEDPALAPVLRSLRADSSDAEYREAIRLICDSGAIERSLELADLYVAASEAILDRLAAYPASRDLKVLSGYFMR
ncbi:polyprenyl synthetase family protein [Cohnella lubricantis]|uniref:Polyprenyl synthetase family protein n=1 Tax=Cohnella lubricantis TaxID=2163172 RepID=A0A841T9L5_9BACL|nr:polyprenyl synthetase family protein [Cohnella lubricantis]MBB6678203.1 polyprenyl synthetase family protein [Cohnella lubricantis]MBP2119670.1 heptaprenyl diphosphate synthase [Cohnella lubricantis]